MYEFENFLEAVSTSQSTEKLLQEFSKYITTLGMTRFAYLNFSIEEDGAPICRHAYDEVWIDRYFDKEYFAIDPIFEMGRKSNLPFTWAQSNDLSKAQQQLMSEAQEWGIKEGFTIPSRSVGFKTSFITLASDESGKEFNSVIKHEATKLHIAALHFDNRFAQLHNTQTDKPQLTARERECLQWAVKGKGTWEIGEILHISEKTVEAHFSNIFKKFNVFSRTQAVVKGISLGLVII